MTISVGEFAFYNAIKKQVKVLFDVGCRDDSPYIALSPECKIHLFEPNPIFYDLMKSKLSLLNNNVILNNFGLGGKTEELDYYYESQSFMVRPKHFTHTLPPLKLKIKRFSEYTAENNINQIDFLKIDTEGWDSDILLDDINFIKNSVKFVQFEYASTWLDRNTSIGLRDIILTFSDVFDFYFLFDEAHPISYTFTNNLTLISEERIDIIDNYMKNDFGFNIAMVGRKL